MAERIVSPGVFTRERDLSFLPQGISEIGAAIIGPTIKGPAFVPSIIRSFTEFEEIFGSTDKRLYTPYAVEQYLKSAGTVTIVRVLNTGGYTADSVAIKSGGTAGVYATGSDSGTTISTMVDGDKFYVTSSVGSIYTFVAADSPLPDDVGNTYFFDGSGSVANLNDRIVSMSAQINAVSGLDVTTTTDTNKLYISSSTIGTAGNSIGFNIDGGSNDDGGGGKNSLGGKVLALLTPSYGGGSGLADLGGSTIIGNWDAAVLTLTGSNWGAKGLTSYDYNISFNTGSSNYIENVFSQDAQVQKSGQNTVAAYLYSNFKHEQSDQGYTSSDTVSVINSTITLGDYSNAETPYIQSQKINNARYNLFKVKTRSHGTNINNKYKIIILNVKKAGSIAGSDYGSFSLQVRNTGLDDNGLTTDNIVEQFDNCNFDSTSPNYFAKRVGDRYVSIDANGKLTYNGAWNNMSKHIYISDYSDIDDGSIPKVVVPMGHGAINNPFGSDDSTIPALKINTAQTNAQGEFDSNVVYGVDYGNSDIEEYLKPVNGFGDGANVTMSLEDMSGHNDASTLGETFSNGSETVTLSLSNIKQRKFVVPFQGGFDGDNPANPKLTGANIVSTNTQGFDCSTSAAAGSVAYKKAINAISNPDEFDINLLVLPGIIHGKHSKISNHAISKVEERGDCFYIMDASTYGDNIATITSAISTLDTNYAATYYPWVKIVDRNTSLPIWVPPSCVLPGVISYTDRVSHEWFAPAGLNRGGLTSVLEASTRLTHTERDDLYEERVNPIASFPGQGVVVWGQKTLQGKPSALDRVNVRRLLIKLKKFIASSSRYLVFEQNTAGTRNRFLNIVNPFLEAVQSNSGLSAFKVVMDDTNNTPDVIDRNELLGQIFIQPTRTAEFIVLDFVVLPTGATFPE